MLLISMMMNRTATATLPVPKKATPPQAPRHARLKCLSAPPAKKWWWPF